MVSATPGGDPRFPGPAPPPPAESNFLSVRNAVSRFASLVPRILVRHNRCHSPTSLTCRTDRCALAAKAETADGRYLRQSWEGVFGL